MKFNAALAKSLLMAASIGMVVPLIAQTSAPKKEAPKPGPAKPAPAPAPAAEEEPEIQLPGAVIARKSGGFLSLTVENNYFKLSFYDAKKKPVSIDVVRAIARWEPLNTSGEERSVLNPAGENALTGNVLVRPPFVFKVYITLIGAAEKASESYVVDFRG